MTYPQFIDIEVSTPDENGFPTAISWSLPDGTLKSVLIVPDDDWEPWDNTDGNVDIQHLMDQGVSGPDVIRELNLDLDGKTVFVDGLDDDETLLELLFETYGDTLSFEIASISKLYPSQSFEDLLSLRSQMVRENQFDMDVAEDKVKSLLFLHAQINN